MFFLATRSPPSYTSDMRAAYHEALEATRLDVVRLGALAGDALRLAAEALDRRDVATGALVVAGDDVLDDLRRKVDAECIELIWRQQPVAGELREIAAMLNIATDLERVGDYAVEIAKNAIKLADQPLRPQRVEIDRIVGVTHEMLLDAMRAYAERDDELATTVIARDAEVDRLYKRSIGLLQEEMQADPDLVPAATRHLFILTSLERTGDRAGNIAWHTKDMLGLG